MLRSAITAGLESTEVTLYPSVSSALWKRDRSFQSSPYAESCGSRETVCCSSGKSSVLLTSTVTSRMASPARFEMRIGSGGRVQQRLEALQHHP